MKTDIFFWILFTLAPSDSSFYYAIRFAVACCTAPQFTSPIPEFAQRKMAGEPLYNF